MVRNITGTLVAVGRGEERTGWVKDVLLSRDRKAAGVAAPAHGLTLAQVRYPEESGIPLANADTSAIKVYDSAL